MVDAVVAHADARDECAPEPEPEALPKRLSAAVKNDGMKMECRSMIGVVERVWRKALVQSAAEPLGRDDAPRGHRETSDPKWAGRYATGEGPRTGRAV